MDILNIRAFRAIDDPATCAEFLREHVRVLTDYGITNVNSSVPTWVSDPNVIVIVAESDVLGIVCGARIHLAYSKESVLPIESAIAQYDPRVSSVMDELKVDGVGEICGLWNANRFSGRGLPLVLGMAATSLSNQLGLGHMVGLVAKYTLKYALRLGYTIVEDVGTSGIFDAYPRTGFLGIVIGLHDVNVMAQARPGFRHRLLSLRLRPVQEAIEDTGAASFQVSYELELQHGKMDRGAYRAIESERLRHTG